VRFGTAYVPMDEALASVHVDVSGRPYFSYNVPFTKTRVGNFDLDLLKDFFRAFAMNAMLNLHVNLHYGENLHHIAEALFKAFGRALAEASRLNPRIEGVLSTKGAL
jgi:imidazoleglycerol-phosphate dehydratase